MSRECKTCQFADLASCAKLSRAQSYDMKTRNAYSHAHVHVHTNGGFTWFPSGAPPPAPADAGVHAKIAPNEQRRRELLAARSRDDAALSRRASLSVGGFQGGSGAVGGGGAADNVNRARLQKIENDKREKQAKREAADIERKRVEQQQIDSHRAQQRLKAEKLAGGGVSSSVVRNVTRAHWAAGRDAGAAAGMGICKLLITSILLVYITHIHF